MAAVRWCWSGVATFALNRAWLCLDIFLYISRKEQVQNIRLVHGACVALRCDSIMKFPQILLLKELTYQNTPVGQHNNGDVSACTCTPSMIEAVGRWLYLVTRLLISTPGRKKWMLQAKDAKQDFACS